MKKLIIQTLLVLKKFNKLCKDLIKFGNIKKLDKFSKTTARYFFKKIE